MTATLPEPLEDVRRGAVTVVSLGFPATPAAVGVARESARRLLQDRGFDGERLEDALLVLNELTTNAVRHGRGWTEVWLSEVPSGLLLQVGDDLDEFGVPFGSEGNPAIAGLESEDGRGLFIVTTLCPQWGVAVNPEGGKWVWAVLPAETGV
ncbi:ATP-binding protein [Actinocorallia lasiicapitis]